MRIRWAALGLAAALLCPGGTCAEETSPEMSPEARAVAHDSKVFLPDPTYEDKPYDPQAQWEIYGGKRANRPARPLLEWGRRLYAEGPFRPQRQWLGKKNLLLPHLHLYGDYRTAVATNDNGAAEQGRWAHRLNLDLDWKWTATERLHFFFRPLDKGGQFSRFDFDGDNTGEVEVQLDGNLDAAFFEGEVGPILAGLSGRTNRIDLPFAVGLMPLLFQNGIWVEDAFTGAAVTLPARNSRALDISNMDWTLFVGLDKVTTRAVRDAGGELDDHQANLYGITGFIETMQGYWELGYAMTDARSPLDDQDVHSVTAAFTRRYGGLVSNSLRVLWNFGQDRPDGSAQNADGVLLLMENSLVSRNPLTLVPYLNLFLGLDRPQSLARDAGAGGVLKNTGILFESDGVTGSPTLDALAQETAGAALGLEYLFGLDRQIVVETALVKDIGGGNALAGDQWGVGVRLQQPLNKALLLRADWISGFVEGGDDLFGVRLELRRKF